MGYVVGIFKISKFCQLEHCIEVRDGRTGRV